MARFEFIKSGESQFQWLRLLEHAVFQGNYKVFQKDIAVMPKHGNTERFRPFTKQVKTIWIKLICAVYIMDLDILV